MIFIIGCPKLASLPELARSLKSLLVSNCESLETLVPFPFDYQIEYLCFLDCFKLGPEARRTIIIVGILTCRVQSPGYRKLLDHQFKSLRI